MNLWFQRRPKDEKRHYFESERQYYEHVAKHGDMLDAMMTIGVLPNPTGAGYFDYTTYAASIGNYRQSLPILSTVSGPTPLGTLMEIVTPYTGPGTGALATMPTVQPSSTTADFLLLGPVDGGSTNLVANAATSVVSGTVCTILRMGVGQILCDATTTAGLPLIQSAATAGAAKTNATPVASKTIGTALQAVTISSGTALVWASIALT